MAPRLRRESRQFSSHSVLGMTEQQKQLVQAYPNPQEHAFRVRLPAHPEDHEQDQALYHIPGYMYPHTLTFVTDFSPEAERRMIQEFDRLRHDFVKNTKQIPPAQSFRGNVGMQDQHQDQGHGWGWGKYTSDLASMGKEWVGELLGLPPTHAAPHNANPCSSSCPTMAQVSHPAKATPSLAKKIRKLGKDRRECIRNGGGPTDFLPVDIYDTTSDTEVDDDDEELIAKYLNRPPSPKRPVMAVFGPGVIITRSIGGTLRPRIVEPRSRTIQASPDNPSPWSDTAREGDIHYPTLPSFSSFSSSQGLPLQPSPTMQPPAILVHSPPTDILLPALNSLAGYIPTYRPRTPRDTVFHRGSAGINPLGAFDRPLRPMLRPVTPGATRPHRIVSGSFGSFEQTPPSRFEERKYRLLPKPTEDKEKRS